jgi:hypothetical protein
MRKNFLIYSLLILSNEAYCQTRGAILSEKNNNTICLFPRKYKERIEHKNFNQKDNINASVVAIKQLSSSNEWNIEVLLTGDITLYDISGNIMLMVNTSLAGEIINIPFDNFSKGIYVLNWRSGKNQHSIKLSNLN